MNNEEIKEILDYLKQNINENEPEIELSKEEVKILLDYITNLQQENFNLRENILIHKMSFKTDDKSLEHLINMPSYEELQQENERLKEDLLEEKKDFKEANDYAFKLLDYKSKCEKAIDNCKKSIEAINTKLENNKEPFEVIDGKIIYLNDYQVARLKAIRMKCKELLNILQNGSDEE